MTTADIGKNENKAKEAHSDVLRLPVLMNTELMEIVEKIEGNGRSDSYAKELYANLLFMEFMILLCRACDELEDCFSHSNIYNQKMIDILRYINEHLAGDLSIDALVEHFYISKYHMMRQFKEETGYTIHQYLTEKRVLDARNRMNAGVPATIACFESGFKDYSTFLRAFKGKNGKATF